MDKMKFHEAALLFPLLSDIDPKGWFELKESIRANGLLDPIITYDGKILDGRNRYIACEQVGAQPTFVDFATIGTSISPLEFAFERNYNRRNLSAKQRAAIHASYIRMQTAQAQKELGKTGGRGNKKPSDQTGRKVSGRAEREARSQIMDKAKVSRSVAQKAIDIDKHGTPAEREAAKRSDAEFDRAHAAAAKRKEKVQPKREPKPRPRISPPLLPKEQRDALKPTAPADIYTNHITELYSAVYQDCAGVVKAIPHYERERVGAMLFLLAEQICRKLSEKDPANPVDRSKLPATLVVGIAGLKALGYTQ